MEALKKAICLHMEAPLFGCGTIKKKEKDEKKPAFSSRIYAAEKRKRTTKKVRFRVTLHIDFSFFGTTRIPKSFVFCKTKREEIRKKTDGNRFFWKRFFFFSHLKSSLFFPEACPIFLFSIQGPVTNGREKDPLFSDKIPSFLHASKLRYD